MTSSKKIVEQVFKRCDWCKFLENYLVKIYIRFNWQNFLKGWYDLLKCLCDVLKCFIA